jgi:hypothetical protein
MTFKGRQKQAKQAKQQQEEEERRQQQQQQQEKEENQGQQQRPHTAPTMRRCTLEVQAEHAAKRGEALLAVATQRQRNSMFLNREMGKIGALRFTGL